MDETGSGQATSTLEHLADRLDGFARRYVPDPFVLAVGLSAVAAIGACLGTPRGPLDVLDDWAEGFTRLLAFAMQMTLVLVTGQALATSPPVARVIDRLAELPTGPRGATALVAFTSTLAALGHWGLGVVVGALLARAVGARCAARGVPVHYPLLGAAGFAGMLAWHGGLSGSIPLVLATPGHFLADRTGVVPIAETLFAPMNVVVSLTLLGGIPVTLTLLTPPPERCTPLTGAHGLAHTARAVGPGPEAVAPGTAAGAGGIAGRFERSRTLALAVAAAGLAAAGRKVASSGLDLDGLNLLFLSFGLACQGSLARYLGAAADGARAAAGVIVQFPLYGGILGILDGSGLAVGLSARLVDVASHAPALFPVLCFLAAGLLNLFVPSGGGQWAIQGPVVVGAAHALGLSIPTAAMAVAYGDQWTNMVQPFWALPLLGLTGLEARCIVGYTTILLGLGAVVFPIALIVAT